MISSADLSSQEEVVRENLASPAVELQGKFEMDTEVLKEVHMVSATWQEWWKSNL